VALKNIIDPSVATQTLCEWWRQKRPGDGAVRVDNVRVPKAGGLSAETVMFDVESVQSGSCVLDHLVARVIPSDPTGGLYMTYDLAKEAAAMRAFRAHTGVPTPEVLAIETDPGVLGGPFLVTRAIEGRIPADDPPYTAEGWVLELDPADQALLHDNALKALAEIHEADPRALGLDIVVPSAAHDDLLGHDIASWRRAYEWSGAGKPNRVLDAAWEWVDANRPPPASELRVSWGDSRFGNMIFDDDLNVRAVLDWEQMTLGPRELDLSWWTVTSYRHHGAAQGHEIPPGFPSFEAVVDRYEELTGYQTQNLAFYDVYSALRLSILAVRAARMLIDAGVLAPDSPMAHNNPTTDILIDLMGLPKPDEAGDYYTGRR
jgi:aminoglycoside phosphotransferase (APT) family kinase protein